MEGKHICMEPVVWRTYLTLEGSSYLQVFSLHHSPKQSLEELQMQAAAWQADCAKLPSLSHQLKHSFLHSILY